MTGETKAELLIRNRREWSAGSMPGCASCALCWIGLPRRNSSPEPGWDQTLNDLITEQMVYARLRDADARALAGGGAALAENWPPVWGLSAAS